MTNWINKIHQASRDFYKEHYISPNAVILGSDIIRDLAHSFEFKHCSDGINQVVGLDIIFVDYENTEKIEVVLR